MSGDLHARLVDLPDEDLLSQMVPKARDAARARAAMTEALMEIERRRLHMRAARCRSLFEYCTRHLGMSRDEAYGRIGTLRIAARYPVVLPLLAEGALTPTTLRLLAPILTVENHESLLLAARYLSKREVRALVTRARVATESGPSESTPGRSRARSRASVTAVRRSRTRSGPSERQEG